MKKSYTSPEVIKEIVKSTEIMELTLIGSDVDIPMDEEE